MLSEGDEQASCWAKACWVGQETFADCWILHGPLKLRHWVLFNPQWKAHISCSDTSSVNVSTLNHRKALTISSIEIMDFFPSLGLVLCGCVEMWVCPSRLQKARSWNPLKLGRRLSTLNFRTCDHEDAPNIILSYIIFFGFPRRLTKGKEVSDWNIYLQQALISGPQQPDEN